MRSGSSVPSKSNNISRLGLDPGADLPPPRHSTLAGPEAAVGRVSAEGAFAGGWLSAGRVRRQGGIGLQRQHHSNLLTRFEVGGA
jgi:hypothetical protein